MTFSQESAIETDIPALLALDWMDEQRFVSRTPDLNRRGSVYGGQLLAQAAQAAAFMTEDRSLAHLHGLYLKGAIAEHPVAYRVEPLQEGSRFSSFRILGQQPGRAVVDVRALFQAPAQSPGAEHSVHLVESVPAPEECLTFDRLNEKYAQQLAVLNCRLQGKDAIDVRLIGVEEFLFKRTERPTFAIWVRPSAPVVETFQRVLSTVYLSDYLVGLCCHLHHRPLVEAWNAMFGISIDHSIWLHATPEENEWLLFLTDSPDARAGRGLCHGRIYGRDGRLIATMMQEFAFSTPPDRNGEP